MKLLRTLLCPLSLVLSTAPLAAMTGCDNPASTGNDTANAASPEALSVANFEWSRLHRHHADLGTTPAPADLATAPPPADMATAPPSADLAHAPAPDLAQPPPPPADMATAPPPADMATAPPPTGTYNVESVAPAAGPAGTMLIVTGSGFQAGDTVVVSAPNLSATALATVSLTSTSLTATLPALSIAAPATLSVQVRRSTSVLPAAGYAFKYTAGKIHFIATNGSDSNAGTISAPWATINGASNKVSAGDLVYIRGGTYTGPYQVYANGTATAPIVFAGYPGEAALITNPSTSSWPEALIFYGAYNIADHLKVTNSYLYGAGISLDSPGSNSIVENCEVYGTLGVGVFVGSNGNLIYRNSIHDNGVHDQRNHGVYVDGGSNIVRSNVIYNNQAYGIQVFNGTAGDIRGNNLIEYNYIYHNGYGATAQGFTWNAGIILADNQPNNTVRYNRICDNAQFGIYMTQHIAGNQILDNVFCYNGQIGINAAAPGTGVVIDGNVTYYDASYAMASQPGVTSNHNTFWSSSGAPQFELNYAGMSFSAYKSASGQDASSALANPGFTNVPTTGFSAASAATYNFCGKLTPAFCNPMP